MTGPLSKKLPKITAGVAVVVIAIAAVLFLANLSDDSPGRSKQFVQQIALVKPPPPPPPPPEVEKPPEPEVVKEKVETPEPEDVPDEIPDAMDDLPAGDQLGLDADGGAGMDGFGLIGKKGGRSLIGGSGSQGNEYAWFSGALKSEITDYLYSLEKFDGIRKSQYEVKVRLWIDREGLIKRIQLIGSTGNDDVDTELRTALASLERLDETPPEGLPQPVTFKLISKL